ncbi:CDF family Co(II)/Ni(II) efflux transporter DmeF [Shewanella schlegeliana]|uniref:CDF family Co(II)/Ni(II) efflux transporter DmeF n=1 Tax=Shewanella schlegeliana TaxID=190308 RepID=A0ABS1SUI9_9GAMM|nr:CDF family Co(II)/Ni(II) efflux transporter DmeF [Shewanella schlegeliana]MBL4912054.1 CDF family Co(II)/Ni(II) efflux transporter DmeF [Shewanella schlegeliana]MCL1111349.1 CDF family Co(II)/Ni(II) efflux transporter DmeF [Shewanella schlegeliana]GIU33113.1 transporter [Shewanella schlegeliana]
MIHGEQAAANCAHKQKFSTQNSAGERNTAYVLVLTIVTMLAEIIAGTVYGSMALLADGWHMGTHAAAFMITLFAYRYARKHANSAEFSYGTGKVSVLGGYTSAIALGLVALVMLGESGVRIFNPHEIYFDQAILVAIIGLVVNVVSVFLLKDHHSHDHGHSHEHCHHSDENHSHDHCHNGHHGEDHNLKAAYFHVLADALTSLLAIGALLMGKYFGLTWLDPVMGIVGALIISRWAWGLLKQTGPVLLDASIEQTYMQQIKQTIDQESAQLIDLHVWKISADHYAASMVINVESPKDAGYFRGKLADFERLSHVTIEVNPVTQAQ